MNFEVFHTYEDWTELAQRVQTWINVNQLALRVVSVSMSETGRAMVDTQRPEKTIIVWYN